MKYPTAFIILVLFFSFTSHAQEERKYIRQGVRDYRESNFEQAELNFRKANEINKSSFEATYNTGNVLYKQEKTEDAAQKYIDLLEKETSQDKKADLYYNLGNTMLKSKEYKKGIEAFKNTLRLRPEDEDARYNLAWAINKLEEQQQQQNQNQDQDKQDQDKQDQDKQDQQNDQQQDQNSNDDQKNKENQPMENKELSKDEMERILQAIEERGEKVKEKVDRERAKAKAVPNEKDW